MSGQRIAVKRFQWRFDGFALDGANLVDPESSLLGDGFSWISSLFWVVGSGVTFVTGLFAALCARIVIAMGLTFASKIRSISAASSRPMHGVNLTTEPEFTP